MVESFFSTDEFLETVADVYFPGAKPGYVRCGDTVVRTLIHRGKAVSGFWTFPFYLMPVEDPPNQCDLSVPFLRDVVREIRGVDEPPLAGCRPAGFIRWRDFPSWEEFQTRATSLGEYTGTLRRGERRLTKRFGPVTFVPGDTDPAVFDATFLWKSQHYQRTGGGDRYDIEQNIEFYRELNRRGLLMVSSLRAGGRIVAAAMSHPWKGNNHYRITTYDHDLRTYSPGAIHLTYLLRQSYESGDEEFDFLGGREAYKYQYATHIRWLSNIGREPGLDHLRHRARVRAGVFLLRHRTIRRPLKKLEADLVRLRHRLTSR